MICQMTSLSAATALGMLTAAIARAEADGLRVAVCVCDMQGHVLASARMDGVTPPILGFAEDKAFTAATMRRSTAAFAERMAASPSLTLGLATRSRLLPWGGGLPVVHDGQVIGGIGVSGARDVEDIACAEAALAQSGFGWDV